MQLATKILICSVLCFFGTIIYSFMLFDTILRFGIRDQTALRKRNELRGIYLNIPFPLNFKIYLFNVTNPEEVTNGGKPKLQEVGPYHYDEWVSKVDVVDNSAEDTLTYSPLSKFYYNQSLTAPGLSHDDMVTILHPVIVGAVTTAAETAPALLTVLAKAIKSIFRDPKTMYLTDKVRNILFDGMTINCTVSDFAGKAVCSQLKTQLPGIVETEKNIFKFSLLGSRNGTLGKRTMVKRGIKDSKQLGSVVEYDGLKKLNMYTNEECNLFRGTDGWIFPPGLTREEGLWTFSGDLCRSIQAKYVEPMPFKFVPSDYYEGELGDQQNDPNEKCYCPTPKTCLKKGLYSLNKCLGVPIIASLPHFYKCDESLLDDVEGLQPNKSEHNLQILFEKLLGTPVKAEKRIQFNFMIRPNAKVTVMNNVPEVLHPLLWFEEGVELEGILLKKVQSIFVFILLNNVLRWFFLVGSIVGMGAAGFLYYRNRNKGVITPVHIINKLIGNDNEVKKFGSEHSSASSRGSERMNFDNPTFENDTKTLEKTKF